MKNPPFYIEELVSPLRRILFLFILTISLGYGFGLRYLYLTTEANPKSLQENYLGNEADVDAEVMKFEKTEKSLLTFLHDHLFALGILQLIISFLLFCSKIPSKIKSFLVFEPFISLLVTFTGIYILWLGVEELKYIIMISGFLFHLTFMVNLVVLGVKFARK